MDLTNLWETYSKTKAAGIREELILKYISCKICSWPALCQLRE